MPYGPNVRSHPSVSIMRQRRRMRMAKALETLAPAVKTLPDAQFEAFRVLLEGVSEMVDEEMLRELAE